MQGVGEAPWGSRAQMLGFCFLDILLSTLEGPCVEYISIHKYIKNRPSDTEVHAKHQLRADRRI